MYAAFVCVFGFLAGLCLGIGFIIGFKAKKRYEERGKFVGGVEEVDPIIISGKREVELEEEIYGQNAILRD